MPRTVTKYSARCPYTPDGDEQCALSDAAASDCDHCYECPECGASELAGEDHDDECSERD
jgi:hypothetical protein